MPLTPYQSQVARLLAAQRTPDSYLAGGAALHFSPHSLRYSNDLDYFNDSAERVGAAFDADRAVLLHAGHNLDILLERPGFVRAIVRRGDESTKVEWVFDTAFRFLPVLQSAEAGFLMHPIDLAINKLLALVGREEPRDYLDTVYAHENLLPLGGIIWAACGKDPGFTPPMLLELLRRKGRYRPEDFARLRLNGTPDLKKVKRVWLEALHEAEHFISAMLPSDLGCLFYRPSKSAFVACLPLPEDVVCHFGRPGGVLPIVIE